MKIIYLSIFLLISIFSNAQNNDTTSLNEKKTTESFFPKGEFKELTASQLCSLYDLSPAKRLLKVKELGLKEAPSTKVKNEVCHQFIDFFINGGKFVTINSCKTIFVYSSSGLIFNEKEILKAGYSLKETKKEGKTFYKIYYKALTNTILEYSNRFADYPSYAFYKKS